MVRGRPGRAACAAPRRDIPAFLFENWTPYAAPGLAHAALLSGLPRRRSVGRVYRRKRQGTGANGKPLTGYYRGWYVRLRRYGREIRRYGGPDRKTAIELLERLIREQDRLELLDEEPPAHIPSVSAKEIAQGGFGVHRRRLASTRSFEASEAAAGGLGDTAHQVAMLECVHSK